MDPRGQKIFLCLPERDEFVCALKTGIRIYPARAKFLIMDPRLLDTIIGLAAFLLLVVLLALLPLVPFIGAGAAYIGAIVIFILFLSGAGYLVNEKIV